jgi:hypothetical protein
VSGSGTPKTGSAPRAPRKTTGGTRAPSGAPAAPATPPPGPARPDILRDLADLLEALRREPLTPGSSADRMLEQLIGGAVMVLVMQAAPHIDVTAVRLTPYEFASRDLDITVRTEKDGDELVRLLAGYRRSIEDPIPEPVYSASPAGSFDPPQTHHQWVLRWRDLNVRIGTVIHPDDTAAEPHAARLPHPQFGPRGADQESA